MSAKRLFWGYESEVLPFTIGSLGINFLSVIHRGFNGLLGDLASAVYWRVSSLDPLIDIHLGKLMGRFCHGPFLLGYPLGNKGLFFLYLSFLFSFSFFFSFSFLTGERGDDDGFYEPLCLFLCSLLLFS